MKIDRIIIFSFLSLTIITMVASCKSKSKNATAKNASIENTWWKEAVVYQIYPRSFKDSDGDGVCIRGVYL